MEQDDEEEDDDGELVNDTDRDTAPLATVDGRAAQSDVTTIGGLQSYGEHADVRRDECGISRAIACRVQ